MSTPIYDFTYQQVKESLFIIQKCVKTLLENQTNVTYTLTNCPGHHASMNQYGGYCFINNAVFGALLMKDIYKNIAILDIDYHHGDGTQMLCQRLNIKTGTTIKPEDFKLIGEYISSSLKKINENIKVLITQEGGYNLELIPIASKYFVEHFNI